LNKRTHNNESVDVTLFFFLLLFLQGLTEAFKAKEDMYGRATFGHEEFLLTVLPFIIA